MCFEDRWINSLEFLLNTITGSCSYRVLVGQVFVAGQVDVFLLGRPSGGAPRTVSSVARANRGDKVFQKPSFFYALDALNGSGHTDYWTLYRRFQETVLGLFRFYCSLFPSVRTDCTTRRFLIRCIVYTVCECKSHTRALIR